MAQLARSRIPVVPIGVVVALLGGLVALQLLHPGGVRGFVEDDLLPALGREPRVRKPDYVKPSRGLKNCRVDAEPFGAKEFSIGPIDGKPGHFVVLVTSGARVTLHVDCPRNGATRPQAERFERRKDFDRFSWVLEPDYRTPSSEIYWLHQGGDEDRITVEWHPR